MWDKDVRISQKKVDESWKEQAERDKGKLSASITPARPSTGAAPQSQAAVTSPVLMKFLNSLAYQVLYHLGELPGGGGDPEDVNTDAAREILEILSALKSKMEGALSQEEMSFFTTIVPELEMKIRQVS